MKRPGYLNGFEGLTPRNFGAFGRPPRHHHHHHPHPSPGPGPGGPGWWGPGYYGPDYPLAPIVLQDPNSKTDDLLKLAAAMQLLQQAQGPPKKGLIGTIKEWWRS